MTIKIDTRQLRSLSALPMIGSAANAPLDGVFSSLNAELAKLYEDRNILLADGGNISFSGTVISFSENLNIVLNSKVAGGSPTVISLGSASQSVANGDIFYAVINRLAATATVAVASSLPAVTSANQEVFFIAKRIDAADTTKRLYFRNGMSLNGGQTARLGFGQMGSSGGSSGDESIDLLRTLTEKELGTLTLDQQNAILDAFGSQADVVTLSTASIANSALTPSVGLTSGSYTATIETTSKLPVVDGIAVVSPQAYAPINSGVSGNTIIFSGDVRDYFPNTKLACISKKVTQFGALSHIFLLGLDEKVAFLTINGTPSYNVGLDQTTVTFTNPDSLDLSMGISGGSQNASLRVIPFNNAFLARSNTSSAYEALAVSDLAGMTTIGIAGQASGLQFDLTGITGSILVHYAKFSPNGTYGFAAALEKTAGNSLWHFFGTKDSGLHWTKFSTTKTASYAESELDAGDGPGYTYPLFNADNVVVANNGKLFSLYYYQISSKYNVAAVYGDLTDNTWALTSTPSFGKGVGIITDTSGSHSWGCVGADLSDLSFVAVCTPDLAANKHGMRWFSAGGATALGGFDASSGVLSTSFPLYGHKVFISGSSPSRITSVIGADSSNKIAIRRFAEGTYGSVTSQTTMDTNADQSWLIGADYNGSNKVGVFYRYGSGGSTRFRFLQWNVSSNSLDGHTADLGPSASSSSYPCIPDNFNGYSQQNDASWYRSLYSRVMFDPNNSDHVFCVADADIVSTATNNVKRAILFEINDISNHWGSNANQYSQNVGQALNGTSSDQKVAQTFTIPDTRSIQTVWVGGNHGFDYVQASASTMTCEIYATSGDVPTGSALASCTLSFADINADGGWTAFPMSAKVTNTSGSAKQYAAVFSVSYGTGTSGAYGFGIINSGGSSGQQMETYNGSSWSTTSSQIVFNVSDSWAFHNVGYSADATVSPLRQVAIWDQESILSKKSSTELDVVSRRYHNWDNNTQFKAGSFYKKTVTISGSTTAPSTIGARSAIGFKAIDIDDNLVFNVSLGSSLCAGKNLTTGVLDSNRHYERSALSAETFSANSVTLTTDSDFSSGACYSFNGSSSYVRYTIQTPVMVWVNRSFAIEAEVKGALPGPYTIAGMGYTNGLSGGGGWHFGINGSGNLTFVNYGNSGAVKSITASDSGETSAYHKVKFTWDGATGKLYRSTVAPYTVFTEVASYSSQQAFVSNTTSGAANLLIGANWNSSGSPGPLNFFNGKIGYVKIWNGSVSSVYDGFKTQPPMVHSNYNGMSQKFIAQKKIGQIGSVGTNFDQLFVGLDKEMPQSMVDSYLLLMSFRQALVNTSGRNPSLQINLYRGSEYDPGTVNGINFKFLKT